MHIGFLQCVLHADWLAYTCAFSCRSAVHMDCLHWVNRDSYLPQGSRGLKVLSAALPSYYIHNDLCDCTLRYCVCRAPQWIVYLQGMVQLAAKHLLDRCSHPLSWCGTTHHILLTQVTVLG